MGSIHKRGRGWEITWRDGANRLRWGRFLKRGDAKVALLKNETLAARQRDGLEAVHAPRLLRDAFQEYAVTASAQRSWSETNGRWGKHILPVFGDRFMHAVRPAEISAFLLAKEKGDVANGVRPSSPQTVLHLRNHLSAFYNWAREVGEIFSGRNPVTPKVYRPVVEPHDPVALDLDDVELIIAHATSEHARDLIRIAVYTGGRRGELIRLERKDIHLKDRYLVFRRSGNNKTTKSKKPRMVPIPKPLLPHLERMLAVPSASPYLFPAEDGGPLPKDYDANGLFQTAMARAEMAVGYEYHCKPRKGRAAGQDHGRSKLRLGDVVAMRSAHQAGATRTELAQRYGVSPRAVRLILEGKRWVSKPSPAGGCGYKAVRPERAPAPCPKCGAPTWPVPVLPPLNFKHLRSTFISHVVDATGTMRAGQQLAGHASEETTRRHYARKQRVAELVAMVDQVEWDSAKRSPKREIAG